MPRRIPRLAALGLILLGCVPTKEQEVSVDLGVVALAAQSPLPAITAVEVEQATPVKGGTASIGPLAEAVFRFPEVRAAIAEAQARLNASQRKALDRMMSDLQEAYSAQARGEANDYKETFTDNRDELYADAFRQLEAAFQIYANSRGEPLSRLAFLQSLDPKRPKVAAEMADLQARIAKLDADFDKTAQAIFAEVQAATLRRADLIEKEVRAIFAEFEAKAARDARRFTSEVAAGIKSELALRGAVLLPAEPGASVFVPDAPSAPLAPKIGVIAGDPDQSSRISHDLSIWLALRRYRLGGPGAKDRTQEFIAWRSSRQGGH